MPAPGAKLNPFGYTQYSVGTHSTYITQYRPFILCKQNPVDICESSSSSVDCNVSSISMSRCRRCRPCRRRTFPKTQNILLLLITAPSKNRECRKWNYSGQIEHARRAHTADGGEAPVSSSLICIALHIMPVRRCCCCARSVYLPCMHINVDGNARYDEPKAAEVFRPFFSDCALVRHSAHSTQ